MPYNMVIEIGLGAGETGQTLTMRRYNAANPPVLQADAAGFISERGDGLYIGVLTIPDGAEGFVEVWNGTTLVLLRSIMPRTTENASARIQSGMTKGVAYNNFSFPMFDAADGRTLKSGLTVTAQRSVDGGAFAPCTNSVQEIGSTGIYRIDLSASDLGGNVVVLLFSATGADTQVFTCLLQGG